MPSHSIRLLILEDNLLDVELALAELESGSFAIDHRQVTARDEFITAVESHAFDLIIADYNLPTYDGLTALKDVRERDQDIPFILVSGTLGEADAIKSMYAGATDYVQKNRLFRLVPVVIRAMREYNERQQIRALQNVLEQRNQAIESAHNGIVLIDAAQNPARTIFANDAYAEILGFKLADVLERPTDFLNPASRLLNEQLATLIAERREGVVAGTFTKPDYSRCHYELHLSRLNHLNQASNTYIGILLDTTERQKLEQQAIKQARLAVVGQLAAGIAHDFNNIMAVITMNADLIGLTNNLTRKTQERVNLIIEQSKHASNLIQQILDFSRQTVKERHPLYLDALVKRMLMMWQRTIPSSIEFEYVNHAPKGIILADKTRLEQALMNLVVNARDALGKGGQIRLVVDWVKQQPEGLTEPLDGLWIKFAISDNGEGISQAHLPYLFEPFFTTKEPEEGTGLGLAQVYGIVKQHDGHILVESEIGVGTEFAIYLPVISHEKSDQTTPIDAEVHRGNQETIMIVEDNEATRTTLAEALRDLDYTVLSARNGQEAMSNLGTVGVDAVITDLIMPEMGGEDLIMKMRARGIDVPILLFSGYDVTGSQQLPANLENIFPLKKPMELSELSSHLRAILSS